MIEFTQRINYIEDISMGEFGEKCGGFVSERGQIIKLSLPAIPSKDQVAYIQDFFQNAEDAIYSDDMINDSEYRYTKYIDIESFAKMYLLQEFVMNIDAVSNSFYCYKNNGPNAKLYAGPVWDFDNSLGNAASFWIDMTVPENIFLPNLKIRDVHETNKYPNILAELSTKPSFMETVQQIWNTKAKSIIYEYLKSDGILSEWRSLYKNSAEMNFIRWNIYDDTFLTENIENIISPTWNENVDYLINFLDRRYIFFDKELNNSPDEVAIEIYLKRAESNDSDAFFNLGFLYASSSIQDFDKSFYWYQKAAEHGVPEAIYAVGFCYINGLGVPKNISQGDLWMEKAAELGVDAAISYLKEKDTKTENET